MHRKAANNGAAGQANPLPYTPIEDADITKSTNQLATNTTYDEAGNVTTDNKFRTMGFGYDANGRMVKATKANSPDALSVYDAAGMRVAEKVNDIWRFLIYDVGGKLVSEYGGLNSTDEGGVKYLLSDWQGSTRAVLSNSGTVNGRSDYSAYGEEIAAGTGLRSVAQGFGSTSNPRQKYALTERDDATGLDHTWFRKNENRAGRWTSPDPYNGSMSTGNPQSFNRYSYVENQPTNFVDPSGLNEEAPIRINTWIWGWWDQQWADYWGANNGGNFDWLYDPVYGGIDFGGGGFTVDDPPLPFGSCEGFVYFLLGVAANTYKNANRNMAAASKSLGAGLMDLAYFGYDRHIKNGFDGFKDELVVPGGQGAGVYGHVLGMAGAALYGLVGTAIGTANSIVDHVQNFYGKADQQGPAEVAGNAAGNAVGNHLWNWLGNKKNATIKSRYDLVQNLKKELCK